STEELVHAAWGLSDDGGAAYALHAFALSRVLAEQRDMLNLGDRWTLGAVWKAFTTRTSISVPRVSTGVTLPDGVEPATEEEVADKMARAIARGGRVRAQRIENETK
ncbi:MAG: hypothetical protein QW761_02820, partial [Candidatus Aenigmatarchaeota archaeon]